MAPRTGTASTRSTGGGKGTSAKSTPQGGAKKATGGGADSTTKSQTKGASQDTSTGTGISQGTSRGGAGRAAGTGPQATPTAPTPRASANADTSAGPPRRARATDDLDQGWDEALAKGREEDDEGEVRPARRPAARPTAVKAPPPFHVFAAIACALGGAVLAWGLHSKGWPHNGTPWAWAAAAVGALLAVAALHLTPRQGAWPMRVFGTALGIALPAALYGGLQVADAADKRAFARAVETRLAIGIDDLDLRPPAGSPGRIADSIFIPVDGEGGGIACLRKTEGFVAQAVEPGPTPGSAVSLPWALRDRAAAMDLCAMAFLRAESVG